jgi:hypothetical protein
MKNMPQKKKNETSNNGMKMKAESNLSIKLFNLNLRMTNYSTNKDYVNFHKSWTNGLYCDILLYYNVVNRGMYLFDAKNQGTSNTLMSRNICDKRNIHIVELNENVAQCHIENEFSCDNDNHINAIKHYNDITNGSFYIDSCGCITTVKEYVEKCYEFIFNNGIDDNVIGFTCTRGHHRTGNSFEYELNKYHTEVDKKLATNGYERVCRLPYKYGVYLDKNGNIAKGKTTKGTRGRPKINKKQESMYTEFMYICKIDVNDPPCKRVRQ